MDDARGITKQIVGFRRRGFSLVGLLITMAMMVVLTVILMTSIDKAVTGEGSTKEGTVYTIEDKIFLTEIHKAFYIQAMDNNGKFLVPSELGKPGPISEDTTANLFSAMIMTKYIKPEMLISPNDNYGWVEVDDDYDYAAYDPLDDVHWDPSFSADLDDMSNVSYAHVPLFGRRFERNWNSSARFPVLGTRGPKDGIPNPNSNTYGKNGQWAGHMIFGDGSVAFIQTFTPGQLVFTKDGVTTADNIYKIEDGPDGLDAILGVTKEMTPDGPVLQWD